MHDEYLWDGTGEVDADVAALERTLAPLRYEAEPVRLPRPEPVAAPGRPLWWIPVLAGAAAAAMVLVIASQPEAGSSGGEVLVERADETVTVGAVETPPSVPEVVFTPQVPTPPMPPGSLDAPKPPPEPSAPPKPAKPSKPAKPPARAKRPSAATVDCALDPSECEDDTLPETLSAVEIRKGIMRVKARALACGETHGLDEATTVKVRLHVHGRTGRVMDAGALSPWNSTPLGTCVAKAVSKAKFPRFRKSMMTAHYPVRFEEPRAPVSVDCILAPEGCKGMDPDLPATLSSADIRRGMAPIKSKVRACGEAHDAPARAKVKVKLAVSGKTGRVLSVSAMAPWAGKPLGACVEAVVRKATFPKFRKERLGVVYPFSFPGE